MGETGRRKLEIDRFFLVAFGRDVRMHDACPQSGYLDLETGDVCFVYEDDEEGRIHYGVPPEENQAVRRRIAGSEGRYAELPGLDHRQHEGILKEFLESEWNPDPGTRSEARAAYTGSVSGWIGALECDAAAVKAYNRYRDESVKKLAVAFLGERGIDPVWR